MCLWNFFFKPSWNKWLSPSILLFKLRIFRMGRVRSSPSQGNFHCCWREQNITSRNPAGISLNNCTSWKQIITFLETSHSELDVFLLAGRDNQGSSVGGFLSRPTQTKIISSLQTIGCCFHTQVVITLTLEADFTITLSSLAGSGLFMKAMGKRHTYWAKFKCNIFVHPLLSLWSLQNYYIWAITAAPGAHLWYKAQKLATHFSHRTKPCWQLTLTALSSRTSFCYWKKTMLLAKSSSGHIIR